MLVLIVLPGYSGCLSIASRNIPSDVVVGCEIIASRGIFAIDPYLLAWPF